MGPVKVNKAIVGTRYSTEMALTVFLLFVSMMPYPQDVFGHCVFEWPAFSLSLTPLAAGRVPECQLQGLSRGLGALRLTRVF